MIITITDERGRTHRVHDTAIKDYCSGCASDDKEKHCTNGIARHIGRPWIGKTCEFRHDLSR